MSWSSIQAATIAKVAKRAAQAAGDEPLGAFGPPFLTGFDVKRTLQIGTMDVAIGRMASL